MHCLSQARQKSWKQSIAGVVVVDVTTAEMIVSNVSTFFEETDIDERSDGCEKLKVMI